VTQVGSGGPEPIRVVISDDHDLFRRGLKMVLEAEEDIEVVAEAADGQQAVTRVEELAPDVVLMDVRMPRMGGIEATRLIRQLFPTTRIIVLTVSDEEDDIYGAVKAGANGYLLKEVSIEEVADAVRAVFAGQLGVSESTVRNHVANILTKLQLRSQIEPAT
jgi:DNA-binding NarL/FixJ family response regulator